MTAFAFTVALLLVLSPLARHVGLVDSPNYRKRHDLISPLIGGAAMYVGFVLSAWMLGGFGTMFTVLVVGGGVLVIVGTVDDLFPLSHYVRFASQITAALIVCLLGGTVLRDLGAISWSGETVLLGYWSIPLTISATVGAINAVNMSDGMDGLAGSLVLVALVGIGILTSIAGRTGELHLVLLLGAVLVAFLCLNLPFPWRSRAKVFMGDSGSMFLGFALACFLLSLSQGEDRAIAPVTALWLFAIPLIDTVSMMLRRVVRRRSPFSADREHYHHILVHAGFTAPQALALIIGFAVVLAGIGLAGEYFKVLE